MDQSKKAKQIQDRITSAADRLSQITREIIRDAFLEGKDVYAITLLIDELELCYPDSITRRTLVPIRSGNMINGGAMAQITARAQIPFRPWYFQISDTCDKHFDIYDIRIGNMSEFATPGEIEGRRFLKEYPLRYGDRYRVGMDLSVVVRNKTDNEAFEFIGYFIGEQLQDY